MGLTGRRTVSCIHHGEDGRLETVVVGVELFVQQHALDTEPEAEDRGQRVRSAGGATSLFVLQMPSYVLQFSNNISLVILKRQTNLACLRSLRINIASAVNGW